PRLDLLFNIDQPGSVRDSKITPERYGIRIKRELRRRRENRRRKRRRFLRCRVVDHTFAEVRSHHSIDCDQNASGSIVLIVLSNRRKLSAKRLEFLIRRSSG